MMGLLNINQQYGSGGGLLNRFHEGPSQQRGSGLLGFLQMISLFISTKMIPTLIKLMGAHGLFYLYSSLTVFVAFICFFTMPDTTGLSLEEIENIYKMKRKLSIVL